LADVPAAGSPQPITEVQEADAIGCHADYARPGAVMIWQTPPYSTRFRLAAADEPLGRAVRHGRDAEGRQLWNLLVREGKKRRKLPGRLLLVDGAFVPA